MFFSFNCIFVLCVLLMFVFFGLGVFWSSLELFDFDINVGAWQKKQTNTCNFA